MRFTEHELTAALTGAAKTVVASQRRDVRRGKRGIDEVWDEMDRLQRFKVLDALGTQLLPVLVALPDVEVATGTRPTFTDAQVAARLALSPHTVHGHLRSVYGKLGVASRTAATRVALAHGLGDPPPG